LTGSAITKRWEVTSVRVYISQLRCSELDNIHEENQYPSKYAVDLEVIKQKSQSTLTETRDKFRELLLERDYCCAFTGALAERRVSREYSSVSAFGWNLVTSGGCFDCRRVLCDYHRVAEVC
jgi:hypothetical protein